MTACHHQTDGFAAHCPHRASVDMLAGEQWANSNCLPVVLATEDTVADLAFKYNRGKRERERERERESFGEVFTIA